VTPQAKIDTERLLAELDALIGGGVRPARRAPEPAAPAEESAPPPAPAPAGQDAAPDPPAEDPARGPAPRILIVEDDKDYRKVVRYLFTTAGYRVTEAGNGAEGLRLARENPPDLALLDFEMPRMNGYELLQELRQREETRKVPVILLTGAANRRHLKELGLDIAKFLEKPMPNAELLAAVRGILGEAPPPSAAAPEDSAAAPAGAAAPDAGVAPEPPAPGPAAFEPAETAPADDTLESDGEDLLIEEQKKEREEDAAGLDVLANDSPLVNRINRILVQAVEMGASDVHVEPQEKAILVRVRVDGTLRLLCRLPIALQAQVAARVKIMSNLTITERRRPQDGQIRAVIKGKKIEFRVSTIPALYGEKIVLRILGGAKLKESLEELKLSPRDLEAAAKSLRSPHGLILVTGPTGSGKSTTLYTMIRQLNQPDVNIMTAEDPVEYELAGITQVPVRAHIGVTFEAVLRSFLRQDPDIMLVGEIRDLETAEIAVKAAITGHLVLSTLHTNSAPAAIMRLTHMGLAPYLVADSLRLVVAQRLVRRLCRHCRTPAPASEEVARMVGPDAAERLAKAQTGRGCPHCSQGYAGRMPIFEVMEVRSPELRQLILTGAGVDQLYKQAESEGMTSLRQAALDAVAAGETSVDEALDILLAE
jgi:type IV pilus assembly protein PilB